METDACSVTFCEFLQCNLKISTTNSFVQSSIIVPSVLDQSEKGTWPVLKTKTRAQAGKI